MDPNTQRSRGPAPEAGAYWQRRFFTLVAGIGVIGLLAWACSGIAGGKPARNGQISAAAYGSAAPGQSAGGQPGAGAGAVSPGPSAWGRRPVFAPAASPSVSSSTRGASSPQPSASRSTVTARSGASKVRLGRHAAGSGTCPAADIVLTLLPSKPSYEPNEQPGFQIYVVSTDASACAFDTGPGSLHVVISHGGQVAWNSAACLYGVASRPTRLKRGVPVTVFIGWNRRLTAAWCQKTIIAAAERTYVAVAQSGAARSPGQPFRLK